MPDDARIRTPVDDAVTRIVAIAALGGIALIHALQLPDAFSEAGYLGGLFIAAVVGAVLLAATLARTGDPRVVEASGVLAGLILIGYLLSRTTGLPGATYDVGEWTEPLGLLSLVVEGLLVCVAAGTAGTARVSAPSTMETSRGWSRRMPGPSAG